MRFSILVPVYNVEKYLEQCVDSLLSQTYEGDYEIILVDDGSTDNSGSICDCLQKQYGSKIKVIHQDNKGQLLSRCAGAECAQGEYCICVDADDIIYKNCLEVLSKAIDRFSNPDIIGYKLERLNQSGEKIYREIPLECNKIYTGESKKMVYETIMTTGLINSMCNKCIKRLCLIGCEGVFSEYKSLRCGEDRLQVLESVTRANTIVFITECLYGYRIFDNSVTRDFDFSRVEKFNMNLLYVAEKTYLKAWGFDLSEYKNKLTNRRLNETIYTFSNFYEKAKSNVERKLVVDFDWDSFLPDDFYIDEIEDGNPNSVLLYRKIKEKDYAFLKVYFFKKAMYKKLKVRLKK